MNIKKYNSLTEDTLLYVENFIKNNSLNNGISFLENDINFYEDMPCFFMLYNKNELVAFMSVFIPDSASCELYFHMRENIESSATKIFTDIYNEVKKYLDEYQLFNRYLLFDNTVKLSLDLPDALSLTFSHSECLMQYELLYDFSLENILLEYEAEFDSEGVSIYSFLGDTHIGNCHIDTSGDYALIHDVEVFEKHRGFGYGKETLYHTINHLKKSGYKNILLHVNSANTIAYTMYSRHGFKIKQQIDYWKI